tara:strand:- start:34 stop:249 length:216 start_codon:yes stop_codon:yes gene_type:complete
MNPHVELVRKWLADPESVSMEEREASCDAAETAYREADAAFDAVGASCTNWNSADAKRLVERYDELIKQGE